MEEDNASDINKFIGTGEAGDQQEVTVTVKDRTFRAKIILRGNVLSVTALEEAHVPLIYVIERVTFKRSQEEPLVLLQFTCEQDNLSVKFDSQEMVEQWMVKLATCSHAISHAQLDEVAYKFFTMGTAVEQTMETANTSTFHNFYLANPTTATHVFAIAQANGLPARRITFEETMWESKLSLLLPMELIKLYRKWNTEFCCLLESKQHSWPASALPSLQEMIREIRAIGETYEQCQEFLSTYTGPQFRKSTEKRRVAFGAVPTNLHLQVFGISSEQTRELITCGTASAAPYGFANGGLTRLQTALEVDNSVWSVPFFSKRNTLQDLKRTIGELSRKIDVEWKMSSFGKPDKVCLEINTGIKQVYERLKDTFSRVPLVDKHMDTLVEEHKRRFTSASSKRRDSVTVTDSLQNQLDNLDAMLISLNTKIAVIDALDDEQRGVYEKSAREAMTTCLDALLMLTESVLEAQLLGLVTSLPKTSTIHQYFHIQIRSDFVFSQAVTIAATAALSRVQNWISTADNDFLFVVFSFLSAYADEKGMIEDACEAWRLVESKAEFKFVRAPSSVCRNCIPVVSGTRAGVKVSLPLPHEKYDALPDSLKSCDSFRIRTAYFNLGVNHEATFAQSFGGVAFETAINQEAAQKIASFMGRTAGCLAEAADAVVELVNAVATEGSRKNLDIFEWAMTACELLGGKSAVSCKSGKDRTSMAVTLEQGRLVRETCGLGTSQVAEVITSLRKDGVRRENCRKNVGKPLYSFSPFQMHFLPKPFRPPMGTYRQGVAS